MKRVDSLPNTTAPTANLDIGVFNDDVIPGDGAGTPVRVDWMSDLYYALRAVLFLTNDAPDNSEEGIVTSQLADTLNKITLGDTTRIKSLAANYVILTTDFYDVYECDTTAGNIALVLPDLATNLGKKYAITYTIQAASNTVDVQAAGADQISADLLTSILLAKAGDRITLYASPQSNKWEILSHNLEFYVKVSDEKASGINGGTFTSGAWQTRDINTKNNDAQGIASIAANQITLEPGKYFFRGICSASLVGSHKARLYDTTGAAVLLDGTTSGCDTGGTLLTYTHADISGEFSLSVQSVLEIQHRCSNTNASTGFGVAANFGVNEIYTIAEFWRIT